MTEQWAQDLKKKLVEASATYSKAIESLINTFVTRYEQLLKEIGDAISDTPATVQRQQTGITYRAADGQQRQIAMSFLLITFMQRSLQVVPQVHEMNEQTKCLVMISSGKSLKSLPGNALHFIPYGDDYAWAIPDNNFQPTFSKIEKAHLAIILEEALLG